MVGKGSLILVIGFAVIFGMINVNLSRLTTRVVENMVGYNQVSASKNLANIGANVGMSMLTQNQYLRGTLVNQTFTDGPFAGGSYIVKCDSTSPLYIRLLSIANYPTNFTTITGTPLQLTDTVQVTLETLKYNSFSYFGWMTNNENGVYFITGDTIDGRVHSNGSIYINGSPVFKQKVTTSSTFDPAISTKKKPTTNKAIFNDGYETGVKKKDFPTSVDLTIHAVNEPSTRTKELYIELKPGTCSDGDGYVLISSTKFASAGGTKLDSIKLSDWGTEPVIYTSQNIHVKGTLDGRLSLGSGNNIIIEDNTKYEVSPKVDPSTNDMLGLISNNNVEISSGISAPGVTIDASIFCKSGSFTAQNYSSRGKDGTINLTGSVCQNTRGAVGTFSSGSLTNGFYKNYKFDPRLSDPSKAPPHYPGWYEKTLRVANWWESYHTPEFF